jgi:4-amino-4-deoxy-L-arabinose transferase-like glycosyltransferase
MDQITDVRVQPLRVAAPTDTYTTRHLLTLGIALAFGGLIVWQLRQEWAKDQLWPWLLLLVAMFAAAWALRELDLWLPGEAVLPRLAAFPARRRRVWGAVCITAALALTGLVVLRLWPDYHKWQGTPAFWLAALALVPIGAWLVGAVGRGSPRAATALTIWRDTSRNRWVEAGAFTLILALAIFLRTYRLDSIPPGIYVDETNGALDALHILEGRPDSPFGTGWYGTPNGYFYYMAAIFRLLGANWTSLKLVSLIPAILTVPAVYLLARLLFGPTTGLCAMLLMAVSRWHLSMSRWGWNETAPPLFQVLSFFFLIRGVRDRRALDYALSGLLMGLATYTYLSSRLAALTLVLYVVYWFLSDPAGWRASVRRSWLGIAILAAAVIAAVAPIAVTYVTDPFTFNNRVSEISVFRDVSEQRSLAPLTQNIADILRFFHQTGDLQGKHNLPGEPMTDPITGLLFAVGLAYAILAWRDQRRVLLLLWLVIGLAGSYFSSHHESPQSYRALTALPAVVLIAGDVLDRIVRALYRALREGRFSVARPYLPSLAAASVAVIALAGATLWESSIYFGRQASSIDVIRGFNQTENSVARETIAALQSGTNVYLSPNFSEYSPLRFLVYGVIKAKTGKNTLDDRPYQVVVPEVSLPLPDNGHDVLILLDTDYWPLRDYSASFYPQARMELVRLGDNSPIYMRIELPQAQVAALQGLTEHLTYADGRQEEGAVAQVELKPDDIQAREVAWQGAIRLEHGGEYDLRGEGGLQVFLDGKPWEGRHYLGRGLYGLRVVWPGGASDNARLIWQIPNHDPVPVPPEALFRVAWPRQGLLGTYYRNKNWEGVPLFRQVTPFMLLAWPDEQPVVPNGEFSARFTGALRVTDPGKYWLRVEADDGARLTLDGKVLGAGLIPNQPNSFEATVELAPGDHPIQIDYFQIGGGTALRLFWRHGDGPQSPVPPSALIPAQP